MRSRTRTTVSLTAITVLSVGVGFASNMGFKIVHPLLAADGGVQSQSGQNTIALPYTPKQGLVDAYDLIEDIGAASVLSVSRYLIASNTWQSYNGTSGSAFPLVPGEGYLVQVSSDVDYRIVGSHNPEATVTFFGPDGGSVNGLNSYAPPFHGTASTAKELIDELGAGVVLQVSKFVKQSNTWSSYNGLSGSDFPLIPGEAYLVQVNSTVEFVPGHY